MMVEIIEFERLVRTLNLLKPLNYFLINYFKLGFFITNGRPTNHRTLLKIFLNPYLRLFGYTIASGVNYNIVDHPLNDNLNIIKINNIKYKLKFIKPIWLFDPFGKNLIYDTWVQTTDKTMEITCLKSQMKK